jgi:hypothetical protein
MAHVVSPQAEADLRTSGTTSQPKVERSRLLIAQLIPSPIVSFFLPVIHILAAFATKTLEVVRGAFPLAITS